jgi:hypothetical protein
MRIARCDSDVTARDEPCTHDELEHAECGLDHERRTVKFWRQRPARRGASSGAAGGYQPSEWTSGGAGPPFAVRLSRVELRPDEAITWHLEYAVAAMHRNDRDDALSRCRAGLSEYPDAGVLRFGLGQELEARGADAAFTEFVHTSYPSVSARSCSSWRNSAALGAPPPRARGSWMRSWRMESRLARHFSVFHHAGVHELEAELHAARTQDFEPLIAVLEQELTRTESSAIGQATLRANAGGSHGSRRRTFCATSGCSLLLALVLPHAAARALRSSAAET